MENISVGVVLRDLAYVVITIAVGFLVPLIKKHISEKALKEMLYWVEIAVDFAQQQFKDESGEFRKSEVCKFLESKGYDPTKPDIDAAIEAAVLKLHSDLKAKGQL